MESFQVLIGKINTVIWSWPLMFLLLGTHLFLTIRLKFPQRKIFKGIVLSVTRDKGASGDVSQFHSLATALAATIGTGNIVGVATAVSVGGPGAVFWCWIMGVLGIATKYSECLLGVKYRVKTHTGTFLGGPMYAIERGMHSKFLAVTFAVLTFLAAFGIGCSIQSNSVSTILYENYQIAPHISGIVLTALTIAVMLFGIKGIGQVCGFLVPFMAFFYILGCLVILGLNWDVLGQTFGVIIKAAFNTKAAAGGLLGAGMMAAMRFGIARGLFSNESGMGSAPIVAAAAQTRNPVRQALVSATGTFWDTVVVCLMTGLVLVSSIIKYPSIDFRDGAALTQKAFALIPKVGPFLLSFGIITFAFSTILGWSYYAEKAIEYLGGKKMIKYYRFLFCVMVYVGAVTQLEFVWNCADILNGLMTIPNIICLIVLSGVLVKETNHYLWSNRLDDVDTDPIVELKPPVRRRRSK